MYDPRIVSLAFDLTDEAYSAQPSAPVVDDHARQHRARRAAAAGLHRLAEFFDVPAYGRVAGYR